MKKCPFCAEGIQDEARKCKHCSSMLDGSLSAAQSNSVPAMERAITLAVIGVVCGAAIGEFYPKIFASGLGELGAVMSEPFSPYRNELAIKYALIIGVVGFIVGLLIHIATKQEENTREHSIDNEVKMETLKVSAANIPDAELIELIERIQPLKDKTQIPFLIECLHHNNSDVKWQAADALGEIQDVIALKTLKTLLSDPDAYVREHVKKAIDKITGAKTTC